MKDHAAILIKNKENKFLFVKRSMRKSTLPGIWAFPSGTVEESESVEETAVREALEEVGAKIEIEENIGTKDLGEFGVRLHFFICNIKEGSAKIMDHDEFDEISWMTFKEFFDKFSDSEIGHGLVYLRQNPELWAKYG